LVLCPSFMVEGRCLLVKRASELLEKMGKHRQTWMTMPPSIRRQLGHSAVGILIDAEDTEKVGSNNNEKKDPRR